MKSKTPSKPSRTNWNKSSKCAKTVHHRSESNLGPWWLFQTWVDELWAQLAASVRRPGSEEQLAGSGQWRGQLQNQAGWVRPQLHQTGLLHSVSEAKKWPTSSMNNLHAPPPPAGLCFIHIPLCFLPTILLWWPLRTNHSQIHFLACQQNISFKGLNVALVQFPGNSWEIWQKFEKIWKTEQQHTEQLGEISARSHGLFLESSKICKNGEKKLDFWGKVESLLGKTQV